MIVYSRSPGRAPVLALVLAGLIGVGAALVLAAPARTAATGFQLTVQGRDTWHLGGVAPGEPLAELQWTFRSRPPFCATGTFVEYGGPGWARWHLMCDDGTGSLTVSFTRPWDHQAPVWNTTWRILDGSGRYADLRGKGSLRIEVLSHEISDSEEVWTWRSALEGQAERDAVAPSITIASARATKLHRPAGAYALRLRVALRDDVTDNRVSYTLRASAGRVELARRVGTATTDAVSLTLRVRPPAGTRTVQLQFTGEDPVGNAVSISRALRLPR
jgi:hypothetical protein